MNIIKQGNPEFITGDFYFKCKKCGCVWAANRGDRGLKISPPCMEFFTYMKCPNCNEMAYSK